VCNSDDDPKREREQIEFLASQRAEGIILSAGSVVPDIDFLRSLGTHIACIDREIEAAEWMSATIVTDYRGGAFAAAQHLIARGHRRIAFLGGAREHFNVRERMAGFELAHREIGIAVDPELVACGSFQHGFGLESTRRLLRQTTFSAICCMSDILAMGACAALREIGKSVPDDCAVIGFDNTFLAPLLQQPLSSVDRRLEESAHLAIAAIVGSIENPDLVCQRHMLHTAVVARQTT
jgi:LacI family transcriptional regulator